MVREEQWDPSVLKTPGSEVSDADLGRFESLGPISPEEVIGFHYALDALDAEPAPELPDFLLSRSVERRR